jgi:FkbM family methyltransferase
VAKNGLVIACEPQPKTFKTLEKNISQNDIKNIIPLNLAITDTAKIASFYVMSDDAYSSLIDTGRKVLDEKIKVLCTTIDGLLDEIKVDFVKIDVEGLELSVLRSMSSLIQRYRPIIFCEIYKGNVESYNPHDTISFLENMGYSVSRIMDGVMVEFCSGTQHDDRYYNYFFLPKD